MISSEQLKQVLTFSFLNGSSFLPPSCTFTATPTSYDEDNIPATITLSGVVIPNDGTNIQWTISNSVGSPIGAGLGTSIAVTLSGLSVPSSLGVYNFTLTVTFLDGAGNTQSINTVVSIFVTAVSLYGQINNPTQTITVASDLTPYLSSLTSTNQGTLINLFLVQALNTGRIVIVVPDSYGVVSDISDNTDASVISQFSVVYDVANNRKIYTSLVAVTAGDYYYKVIF